MRRPSDEQYVGDTGPKAGDRLLLWSEGSVDYLAKLARRQPDEPAVIDDRPDGSITQLSWADFNAYVNRIANGFLALGLEPLDKLA